MTRHNIILTIGALGIVAVSHSAPAADATKSTAAQIIRSAFDAYRAGDCGKVTTLIAPLLQGGRSVAGPDQAQAYDLAITCAIDGKDIDRAGDYARRATDLPDGSDFAWRIRFGADAEAKRYAAAIDTLERMMQGHANALNALPPVWLWQVRSQLARIGDDANETRLLKILANPSYDPVDLAAKIQNVSDAARAMYARKLIKAGQLDEARALLKGVQGFDALSDVAFDPEMLALRGEPIDLHVAVENDLVRHREMTVRYPRWLGAINAVAVDLNRLGRNDEAIAFLRAAIPKLDQAEAFVDRADALPWFWDRLASSYAATGQYNEMAAAYAKGAALPERGQGANVSQIINLAEQQVEFGRAREALATLEQLGDKPFASPYGMMQIRIVRGRALAALGQFDKVRVDLDYAVANPKDDPKAIAALNLCVGDENGAAASFVARLGNPDTRRIAMLELADYDAPDPRKPVDPFDAAFDRVRKRPDVVAAIRSAGGPLRIRLQRDTF